MLNIGHLRDVVFGVVGAQDRLDFTVIGPAVNLAFRLEGLTKQLGTSIIASAALARTVPTQDLGNCDASLVTRPLVAGTLGLILGILFCA
jgi:class 3 adenylate cyclase